MTNELLEKIKQLPDGDGEFRKTFYMNGGLEYQVSFSYGELKALAAEVKRLTDLSETLKQEAQIHAQEARTANSTIYEIYQAVSGSKGEPGNWNGAEPVKKEVKRLREGLATATDTLTAIRDADYRGNRPTSSSIAEGCLKAISKILEGE